MQGRGFEPPKLYSTGLLKRRSLKHKVFGEGFLSSEVLSFEKKEVRCLSPAPLTRLRNPCMEKADANV